MGDRLKKRGMLLSVDKNELTDRQTGNKTFYTKFAIGFVVENTEIHSGLDIQEFTGSEKYYELLKDYYGTETDFVVEFTEEYNRELRKKIPKKKIVQIDDVELA